MNLSPGDLNPNPYSLHLTNIYTCGMATTPRVCVGFIIFSMFEIFQENQRLITISSTTYLIFKFL